MLKRPTACWREEAAKEAAEIAAGTLRPEEAYTDRLYPPAFLTAVDMALDAYEADVRSLRSPTDEEVLGVVERVVIALNAVSDESELIETSEREELCEYIDEVLTEAGVDLDLLAARQGIDRHELTDAWRDW